VLAGDVTAAELVFQARQRAGLTQAELARRVGITQSVVSVYESGRRQPSFPLLVTLVAATGFDLRVELDEPEAGLERLTGPLGRRVRARRFHLSLVARRYRATGLRVVGAVAEGTESADDVVTLVVGWPDGWTVRWELELRNDLTRVLGVPVDIVAAPTGAGAEGSAGVGGVDLPL